MVVDTRNLVVYWRLTPDNRLLFGGRARFAVSNPQSDEKSGRILKAAMVEVFPELAGTRIDYCWGGMVDMTRDRLPRAGERDGIFYSMGYSGHGTHMSTLMGSIMADVMDGRPDLNPWKDFDWPAIPGYFGRPWFLPILGAYYRMKDLVRMMTPLEHLSRNGHLDKFFIDGQWVEPSGAAKGVVVNPATEEVVSQFPLGNGEDVDAAVSAARRAFATWSRTTPEYRAGLLDRLQALLEARSELLAQCLTLEMGAAIGYARTAQVPLAIAHVKVASEVLAAFPFVKQRGQTAIAHEPIGVCALITPWNWPLYQITAKVAPALAAGCTVVLKPSELSPLDALLFAEAIEEAGFPAGVFNLVQGDGPCVGAGLASHPDVDMISITGSTRAGIAVAQAAAPTVKRVAQELGGKSPNVILPDADLDRAVSLGIAAAFRNLGQSCSAPTRMIVPRARLSEIEAIAKRAAARDRRRRSSLGDHHAWRNRQPRPIRPHPNHDRRRHFGRREAPDRRRGSTRRSERRALREADHLFRRAAPACASPRKRSSGRFSASSPTTPSRRPSPSPMTRSTAWGPMCRARIWTLARDVASQIRSGQVHLNYPAWDPHAPFGGFKQSGNGREYGIEGMLEYLEVKSILGYF